MMNSDASIRNNASALLKLVMAGLGGGGGEFGGDGEESEPRRDDPAGLIALAWVTMQLRGYSAEGGGKKKRGDWGL